MLTKEEHLIIHATARQVESEYARINISEVSRRSGYDRKTIRKYLAIAPENFPAEKERAKRTSKLDPYKEYISKRLNEQPEITAKKLLDEVRKEGYTGGYTILKEYVITVRATQV
jgi:transposase